MNVRKTRPARGPMQDYLNRNYVQAELADIYFDTLNVGKEGDFLFCTGCLDALDTFPAGSMKFVMASFYDASTIERGRTAAEVQKENDIMNSLMDEIVGVTNV